jgi:hypothetical protein
MAAELADKRGPEGAVPEGVGEAPQALREAPLAPAEPEVEAEVQAIAAWFDALSPEWQRYFDHEARSGRQAYHS